MFWQNFSVMIILFDWNVQWRPLVEITLILSKYNWPISSEWFYQYDIKREIVSSSFKERPKLFCPKFMVWNFFIGNIWRLSSEKSALFENKISTFILQLRRNWPLLVIETNPTVTREKCFQCRPNEERGYARCSDAGWALAMGTVTVRIYQICQWRPGWEMVEWASMFGCHCGTENQLWLPFAGELWIVSFHICFKCFSYVNKFW